MRSSLFPDLLVEALHEVLVVENERMVGLFLRATDAIVLQRERLGG